MYLQITTKCNMKCAHCGYACTAKGKHMPMSVVRKALEYFAGDVISIGGGEPTLHPKFWEIIGLSLGSCGSEEGYVWLATNGSITPTALALANMAKRGILGVALSRDQFHDPIDQAVIDAFTKPERNYDGFSRGTPDAREIRDTSHNLIKAGRCEDGIDECICEDILVEPSGQIRGCGCKDAQYFGTVFNPQIPECYERGTCSNKQTDEDDHS